MLSLLFSRLWSTRQMSAVVVELCDAVSTSLTLIALFLDLLEL